MAYPTITETTAQAVVIKLLGQPANRRESFVPSAWDLSEKPSEIQFDESQLTQAVASTKNWWDALDKNAKKKNQMLLEGKMAAELHAFLNYHDEQFEFTEDPDFWRYLAVFPLRWFLLARHPELPPESFGGLKPATTNGAADARPQFINQLVFRTFLRGQIAFDASMSDQYERARILEEKDAAPTDIWQSHLLRTQLGQLGECPHVFIDAAVDYKANNGSPLDSARKAAKLLTRAKHNVLFDIRDKSEMRNFVDDVFA